MADEREFLAEKFDLTAPLLKWVQIKSFDPAEEWEENNLFQTHYCKGVIGEDPEETKIRGRQESKA